MLPLSLELWELFSLGIPVAVVLLPEVKLHYSFDLQPDAVKGKETHQAKQARRAGGGNNARIKHRHFLITLLFPF